MARKELKVALAHFLKITLQNNYRNIIKLLVLNRASQRTVHSSQIFLEIGNVEPKLFQSISPSPADILSCAGNEDSAEHTKVTFTHTLFYTQSLSRKRKY
jgi:hypothetical protein